MNASSSRSTRSSCPAARRRRPISISRAPCRAGPSADDRAGGQQRINPLAIPYINRLSDHLFVLARRLNDDGAADVLWVPGGCR